jgi:hypothetical protein
MNCVQLNLGLHRHSVVTPMHARTNEKKGRFSQALITRKFNTVLLVTALLHYLKRCLEKTSWTMCIVANWHPIHPWGRAVGVWVCRETQNLGELWICDRCQLSPLISARQSPLQTVSEQQPLLNVWTLKHLKAGTEMNSCFATNCTWCHWRDGKAQDLATCVAA